MTSAAQSQRNLVAAISFADSSPGDGPEAFTADEKKSFVAVAVAAAVD